MKRPPPETILAFELEPEHDVIVVDRSTLERWATCPAQAALVEMHGVRDHSDASASGAAAHEAIASAIEEYIQMAGEA